jgi:hypothetical protein
MSGCDFQNKRFLVPMETGDNYYKIDWGKKKKSPKKNKMKIRLKG